MADEVMFYVGASPTSQIFRIDLKDASKTDDSGLTGLTYNSTGLVVSTIHSSESSATVYKQAEGNLETISTLGTFAAPTSGKARFKEVDATNHAGDYEIQLADARMNFSSGRMRVKVYGASALNIVEKTFVIVFDALAANTTKIAGVTQTGRDIGNALPAAAPGASGGLPVLNASLQAPETPHTSTYLDATVSSRSKPETAQTITSNSDITDIKGKVDLYLDHSVADASTQAATAASNASSAVDAATAAQSAAETAASNASDAASNAADALAKATDAADQTTPEAIRADLGMAAANMDTQLGRLDVVRLIMQNGPYFDWDNSRVLAYADGGYNANPSLATFAYMSYMKDKDGNPVSESTTGPIFQTPWEAYSA